VSIDLRGKRVLVTGGTSGIGKAIVLQAAQAGADVAFCGLTDQGAGEVQQAVAGYGRRVYFGALDLSDLEAARRFTGRAIDALGGLDGLVNNAGANFKYGVLGSTFDRIQQCMMLNFYAPWAISQTAYPALKASGQGRIVNIASTHIARTEPGTFPYNASKAALHALTQAQAHEWAADNILAVTIAPGWVDTPILEPGFAQLENPAAERQRIEDGHLLGHMVQPEGVASLTVYLLSEANTALTGNTIILDGGMHTVLTPRL
jgi:glucose 1-dehydrogenase